MEETRFDVTKQTAEELKLAAEHTQLIFRFNHTLPGTDEYTALMRRIFPTMGEGSRVEAPLTAIRPHCVHIGRDVIVMPGCLMMSAGGIPIDDGAMSVVTKDVEADTIVAGNPAGFIKRISSKSE